MAHDLFVSLGGMRLASAAVALMLLAATEVRAQSAPAVRAWEGELNLSTTVEGPANPNPPFDEFAVGRFNYPYALREALTGQQRVVRYRALFLENEFLKVTVLPELGGHLYSCLDKISGQEMFYANRSIKKALIGYRGAWAAFGIEFNFPVSHNWMSLSPVDAAVVSNADGSASIWVGNVDRVFGSQWRVELRLAPGEAVLQQHTTLVNQGRRAPSLLLVDQRRRPGPGRLATDLSDTPDGDARVHGDRALACGCERTRHERHPEPDRRTRVALHLRHSRAVHRRLASLVTIRHRARRRRQRAADRQSLVVGLRPGRARLA